MDGQDLTSAFESLADDRRTGELADARVRLERAATLADVQMVVRTSARRIALSDGASFVLRDGTNCFYADEDAITPLWKGERFPMTSCISGWAMLNARPAVIEDIYDDERIPHEAYRPTFVESLAMVPIGAEAVGAIGVYWATTHRASSEEVVALEELAAATAAALERVGTT